MSVFLFYLKIGRIQSSIIMWYVFCEVFIVLQFSSYFNAALEQTQNLNVTQVNPAPPTTKPEGLLYL